MKMTRMNGADAILRSLEAEGVEVMFGIPGGAIDRHFEEAPLPASSWDPSRFAEHIFLPDLIAGCTGCGACLLVCPDFCFEVYKYDEPVVHEGAVR